MLVSLLAKLTGKDRHYNDVALFHVRSLPLPNQIIAQSTWNESAEQEKQLDINFVGVGVDDLQ